MRNQVAYQMNGQPFSKLEFILQARSEKNEKSCMHGINLEMCHCRHLAFNCLINEERKDSLVQLNLSFSCS